MVKVGFIVEGYTEAILINASSFRQYLNGIGLQSSEELLINAKGKNNLYHPEGDFSRLKSRMDDWLQTLINNHAEIIFILLDRDAADASFAEFKSKVYCHPNNVVVVAVQAIEAWFLADTNAMQNFLENSIDEIAFPESYYQPFAEIERLRKLFRRRGIENKVRLANTIIHRCNFSLAKAAAHPACPSAAYFQRKLTEAVQNR